MEHFGGCQAMIKITFKFTHCESNPDSYTLLENQYWISIILNQPILMEILVRRTFLSSNCSTTFHKRR